MGEVSYAFMRKLINQKIDSAIADTGKKYRALAEGMDKTKPDFTEKLLELSIQFNNQCKEIALGVLNQYPTEVANDTVLMKLKESASKT